MKNRNIIFITVGLITAGIIGIISMSKIVELSWQKENTSDNNLNAEIIDSGENIFDYPFVIDNGESFDWENEYISTPPEQAISYQEAANIGGETIKYMYGYTDPQTVTAKVCYYDRTECTSRYIGTKYYYYNVRWDSVEAFAFIDSLTGEPVLFQLLDMKNNNDAEWPGDIDREKIISDISSVLQYLDKAKIVRYGITNIGLSTGLYRDKNNSIKSYQIDALLEDNTQVQFWIDADSRTDNKLITYMNLTALNEERSGYDSLEFSVE